MSGVIIVCCASLALSPTLAHTLSLSFPPQASKANAAHEDPISRKSASYASSKEVCKFIMELGISKVHNPVTISLHLGNKSILVYIQSPHTPLLLHA